MSTIEFLAAVSETGSVAGVGLGSSPEEIHGALGDQCVADKRKRSLRVDYGIVEFNLFGGRCETIAVQVHRLASGKEGLVPDLLRPHFAALPVRVLFDELRNEIERDGPFRLEKLQGQYGYQRYRMRNSHVNFYVVDEVASDRDVMAPGDLWSIMISSRG